MHHESTLFLPISGVHNCYMRQCCFWQKTLYSPTLRIHTCVPVGPFQEFSMTIHLFPEIFYDDFENNSRYVPRAKNAPPECHFCPVTFDPSIIFLKLSQNLEPAI